MKFFFTQRFLITFVGALLIGLAAIHCKNTFYESLIHYPVSSLVAALQYIPQAGDVICCEDGSTYTIMDVSQYHQVPADPGFEALFVDALSNLAPKADAIHFTDISSDYLFVKNRYEMYRMLYTLNQSLELDDVNIQLSIPHARLINQQLAQTVVNQLPICPSEDAEKGIFWIL